MKSVVSETYKSTKPFPKLMCYIGNTSYVVLFTSPYSGVRVDKVFDSINNRTPSDFRDFEGEVTLSND